MSLPAPAAGFGSGARVVTAANVAVLIGLATLATIFLNLLVARAYWRADWTSAGAYTLSEKTRGFLATLPKPVRIVVFYQPAAAGDRAHKVHHLAREYGLASDRVIVDTVDPARDPAGSRRKLAAYRISEADVEGVPGFVVFEYEGRTKHVTDDKLFQPDYAAMTPGQQPPTRFKGEDQFTSAIVALVEGKRPSAAFLVGHGEIEPTNAKPEDACTSAREQLFRDTWDVENLNLTNTDRVGKPYDVIVIVRPTAPFNPAEVHALQTHLAEGGNLIVLLGPHIVRRGDDFTYLETGLEALLAEQGIHLTEDLLNGERPVGGGFTLFSDEFPPEFAADHPVSRDFTPETRRAILFPKLTRSVRYDDKGRGRTTGHEIAHTTRAGRAVTDFVAYTAAGQDQRKLQQFLATVPQAVIPCAAVSEATTPPAGGGRGARVAVVGNGAFVADDVTTQTWNLDLFVNLANWAAGRETLLNIPAKDPSQVRFQMLPGDLRLVFFTSFLLLPFGAFALGFLAWWVRRK